MYQHVYKKLHMKKKEKLQERAIGHIVEYLHFNSYPGQPITPAPFIDQIHNHKKNNNKKPSDPLVNRRANIVSVTSTSFCFMNLQCFLQPTQIALYHAVDVVGKRTLLKMDILSERNPILLEFIKKGCVRLNQLVNHKV